MNKIRATVISLLLPIFIGYSGGTKAACKEQDGSLDSTFGNHGKVVTAILDEAEATGVVVLPCGDIVAAGSASLFEGTSDFALARYTPYGDLNTRFGTNGIELTDFGTVLTNAHQQPAPVTPSFDEAHALALQKNCDGCDNTCASRCNDECNNNCKLVVVGESNVLSVTTLVAARYNCDGTLDTSFGTGGVVVIPTVGSLASAQAVAIQIDGKIVLAGFISYPDTSSDFIVVRLNCDGTLDRTFGCDRSGIVIIDFGGFTDVATAVKIQRDGRIVVGGYSDVHGGFDFALARLTSNGRLDVSFGDKNVDGLGRAGKVVTDFSAGDIGRALVLVDDCGTCCSNDQVRIVIVGDRGEDVTLSSFALAGFTAYGELDVNFGQNGLVVTPFPDSIVSIANAAVLEHTCTKPCKIVVAGTVGFPESLNDFVLARYTLDGKLDKSFGDGGIVITPFLVDNVDVAYAVALQKNGDIVAAGFTDDLFALARYKVCDPCCTPCGLVCASCMPCH